MKRKVPEKLKNAVYPLLALAAFITVWAIAAAAAGIEIILPTPVEALKSFIALLQESAFYKALGATVLRSLQGFALSALAALILASLAALIKPIAKALDPIVTIIRATPTMSIILIALVWMSANGGPVFISSLIAFPIMYSGFYTAFVSVPRELTEMSDVYKVSNSRRIFSLYLPSAAPAMFGTMKSCISLNLKVLIAAEVMAQTRNSMGFMMQRSMVYFETADLIAWTIAAIIISYALEYIIVLIARFTMRWPNV